jgi:crossover junction endodeoxyribonuclease RusA
MALHRARKEYKRACILQATVQGLKKIQAEKIRVKFSFHPPSKRRLDLDNCVARMKAGIDAIAFVAGVDDSKWLMEFEIAENTGGFVEVLIEELSVSK